MKPLSLLARPIVLGLLLILGVALLARCTIDAERIVLAPSPAEQFNSQKVTGEDALPPSAAAETPSSASSAAPLASDFGSFRGRVIDAVTRKPVGEFAVEFQTAPSNEPRADVQGARTFRTPDGRFEWERLPLGDWILIVSATAYQRFEHRYVVVSRGAAQETVIPLRAGETVRGRIFDEVSGDGIASAGVGFRQSDSDTFASGPNWRSRVRTTANKDGLFVLEGVPPGRITLEIHADDYAGREVEIVAGGDNPSLEIGLSTGGMIAGRMTLSDGVTPMAGATVSLEPFLVHPQRTGDAGEFAFRNLPAGNYRLAGQSAEGSASRELVLAANQRIEGVVLALSAGYDMHGVVTGLRNDDLKQVYISLNRESYQDGNTFTNLKVDESGAFVLRGVEPGRVHMVITAGRSRQLIRNLEMPAGSDLTVSFDFPRGAKLSGRITRGASPLAGVVVFPWTIEQQAVNVGGTVTSKQGEYAFEDLPVGEYALVVGNTYKSRRVRVDGDTRLDVDVPPAQISGRVLEQTDAAPIVGANVDAWAAESGARRLQSVTNHYGDFSFAGLEPGDVILTVHKPGYEMFRKRLSYTGEPVADMSVQLRRDPGVELRVRDKSSGKPLAEVFVVEIVGERHGSLLRIRLDQGIGHLPAALAGSTLSIQAHQHSLIEIRRWDGRSLDLQLERSAAD